MENFSTDGDNKVLSTIFEESSPKDKILVLLNKMKPEELERLM
jgi:hypothetical protein